MIKLVFAMQGHCRGDSNLVLFTPLLANKALIYIHIVRQTLLFIYTILCLFVCFYFSLLTIISLYYRHNSMVDVMFITVFENGQ